MLTKEQLKEFAKKYKPGTDSTIDNIINNFLELYYIENDYYYLASKYNAFQRIKEYGSDLDCYKDYDRQVELTRLISKMEPLEHIDLNSGDIYTWSDIWRSDFLTEWGLNDIWDTYKWDPERYNDFAQTIINYLNREVQND